MFSGMGLKVINSDDIFEKELKKLNISTDIDPKKWATFIKQMAVREKVAKPLTALKKMNFIDGMLPIIIDGTGRDFEKIKNQKLALEQVGYDTYMIFVNTTLETSLQRNRERERSVPERVVKDAWNNVQKNFSKFKSLFSSKNFKEVNQDISQTVYKKKGKFGGVRGPQQFEKWRKGLHKIAYNFVNSKLENKIGKQVISDLKMTGGKLLSDLQTTKDAVDKVWDIEKRELPSKMKVPKTVTR